VNYDIHQSIEEMIKPEGFFHADQIEQEVEFPREVFEDGCFVYESLDAYLCVIFNSRHKDGCTFKVMKPYKVLSDKDDKYGWNPINSTEIFSNEFKPVYHFDEEKVGYFKKIS
jgi:hypothetical protein